MAYELLPQKKTSARWWDGPNKSGEIKKLKNNKLGDAY